MTCRHKQIRTWVFEDTKEPAGLWSCVDCGLKFEPLSDERLELIGHADLAINNIYIFNGYGEEVPEGRMPIYVGYKAAHGIKEKK